MPSTREEFSLRRLAVPTFGPSLMFGPCEGASLGPGQPGEIVHRGANAMPGYLIRIVDALPATSTGKVQKHRLHQQFEAPAQQAWSDGVSRILKR